MTANPHPVELRYVVVWSDSVERHETYIRERALADAYAAKHHGIVVVMGNLSAWPTVRGNPPNSAQNGLEAPPTP